MQSFVRRKIDVTFTLGQKKDLLTGAISQPTFSEAPGANQVTLSGLRVSAHITKAGGLGMSAMQLRIFGMTLSKMNELSTLGLMPGVVGSNTVAIMAGDDQSGMSLVFSGGIGAAWADFSAMPEVVFHVEGYAGLPQAVQAIPPTSYQGAVDAAVILAGLAKQMQLDFENSGVSVMLSSPYFPGDARTQAYACARAANIGIHLDDNMLAIWPSGGSRGGAVPLVSPETGLIGYPAFNAQGIALTTLYNPAITFGGKIQVKSSLTPACGLWQVYNLDLDLESEMPNGAWFSRILAGKPGMVIVAQ